MFSFVVRKFDGRCDENFMKRLSWSCVNHGEKNMNLFLLLNLECICGMRSFLEF